MVILEVAVHVMDLSVYFLLLEHGIGLCFQMNFLELPRSACQYRGHGFNLCSRRILNTTKQLGS